MSMRVDEKVLDGVRFGRSKFLAGVGGALLGVAGSIFFPKQATADVAPYPCCCSPHCCGCYNYCSGCPGCSYRYQCGGGRCWTVCTYGDLYSCCDFFQNGRACTCSCFQGTCG